MKAQLQLIVLVLLCECLPHNGSTLGATDATYQVPQLPADNLVKNPWFRNRDGTKPGMDSWISDGRWGATDKDGNPTPDKVLGTAARISTGRGEDQVGQTVQPGVDTYLYQTIAADPAKRMLKFDMYWVTHTVNPGEVIIFGGESPDGPWNEVWKPFYQVHTKAIIPESRRGQDLWKYYSDSTDLAVTTLSRGWPYYKLEVHAILPDESGGFKITGIYFTVAGDPIGALRINSTVITNVGLQIGFTATEGTSYSMEYCDSLSGGVWQAFADVPAGVARSVTVTASLVIGHAQRFYRIVLHASP